MIAAVILVFLTSPCFGLGKEPKCSKFDYEEKTLEKMIRMELKSETILEEIRILKQETTDAVKKSKQEIEKKISEIDESLSDLAKLKTQVQGEVQTALAGLSPVVITFKAQMTKNVDVASGNTLIFPDVVSNFGSGYDSGSGVFTAPIRGVYMFSVQVCCYNQESVVIEMVVGGEVASRGMHYNHNAYSCYSRTDIMILESGGQVFYRLGSSSTSSVIILTDEQHYNSYATAVLVVKQ